MSKQSFYKIIASPRHQRNILTKILHNPKKRQVIISILSIYTLVGGLVAFTMFSKTEQPAIAYEPALISSTIQLDQDKEFEVGDTVKVNITLQNTSSEQSINDIDLELQSTKDIIKWNKVEYTNQSKLPKNFVVEKNHAKLDLLSSGERTEYLVSGTLSDNQIPLSTVIGKITFTNQEGLQTHTTNKILVTAKEQKVAINNTLELKSNKNAYKLNEKISLTLAPKGDFDTTNLQNTVGKIYITNKATKEIVRDDTCTIDETNTCVDEVEGLPVGRYSMIFIDKDEVKYSLISQFEILGQNEEFQPDGNATLSFPFGEKSVNGVVAIYAQKVVSLNNVIQQSDNCKFEVLKDGNVVASINAKVDSDGTCHSMLSATQVPDDGIYTIRLGGTNKQKEISIVKKSDKLITLVNKNLVLSKNNPVSFEATDIKSLEDVTPPANLNDKKVTLGILYQPTGEYVEVNNANGDLFKVVDGTFKATLPGQSFVKGGLYSVYLKSEDGQMSDFVTVSLDDKEIGFTSSNVLVDNYDNLRVGKTIVFKVQGLTDRNNNQISGGECGADIYTSSNTTFPILAKGEIKDGECSVKVDPDKITQAGPILVSFTGDDITNTINQSRQFIIQPGQTDDYGYLNLEYEPAREGYANNVIIGPVTDVKGNLTNALNKKLVIKNGDQVIKQIDSINIENGFSKISLPGSTLTEGSITLTLFDNDEANTLLLTKIIQVIKSDDKLFLPAFPAIINSNEKIKVGMDNIPNATQDTECKLTFIRSDIDYFSGSGKYNTEKNTCIVEFDLDTLRNNSTALLRYQVGELVFSNTVSLESSEPSNLFTLTPQIEQTKKDELNISLLSSPIIDKQGKIVENGKVKIQYNGKIEEVDINNGIIKLDIDPKKLDTKDINTKLDQKFLELNINAKASVTSISKTNNISLYLGKKDIATYKPVIVPQFAQTQIEATMPNIFAFTSDVCEVNIVSLYDNKIAPAKTHQQGETCYVQVIEDVGNYKLSFEQNGFEKYSFNIKSVPQVAKINWNQSLPINVEIIGETKGEESVIVYDGDNQYKFENKENNSGIKVEQNGLNPIKDYLIEVKYTDKDGNAVSNYKTVTGEKIMK